MTLAINSARLAGPRDPEGGGRNEKEDDIVRVVKKFASSRKGNQSDVLRSRSQHRTYFVFFEGDVIVYLFLKGRGKRLFKAEKSWLIDVIFWVPSSFFVPLSVVQQAVATRDGLERARELEAPAGRHQRRICGLCINA